MWWFGGLTGCILPYPERPPATDADADADTDADADADTDTDTDVPCEVATQSRGVVEDAWQLDLPRVGIGLVNVDRDDEAELLAMHPYASDPDPTSYDAWEPQGIGFTAVIPAVVPPVGDGAACLPGRYLGSFQFASGSRGADLLGVAGGPPDGFDEVAIGVPALSDGGGYVAVLHSEGASLAEAAPPVASEWCLTSGFRLGEAVVLMPDAGDGPAVAATLGVGSPDVTGVAVFPLGAPAGMQDAETAASAWLTISEQDPQGGSFGGTLAAVERSSGVSSLAFGTMGDRYDPASVFLLEEGLSGLRDSSTAGGAIEATLKGADASPDCQLAAPIVALDLDGDGLDDLAMGFPEDRRVAVLGDLASLESGLDAAAADLPGALGAATCFGGTLASAGDLDGDGQEELAVGAPSGNGGVWLFDGCTLIEGEADAAIDARVVFEPRQAAGNALGWTLLGGDDLDGDDLPDLVLGEDPYNGGRIYLHPGSEL